LTGARDNIRGPDLLRRFCESDTQMAMAETSPRPLIGIPVSFTSDNPQRTPQHVAGDKYIRAAKEGAGGLAMLVPALPELIDFDDLADRLDGLLLTGGRANVEPHHYGAKPFPPDEIVDPARDGVVLPLIRACVERGVPVFGICRGIQEINVALGGSLHYRIHELEGKMDHRMRRDLPTRDERFGPRHPIVLTEGGLFHRLNGEPQTIVNSLHGQGIDRVAPGVAVEAVAEDGVVEGIRLDDPDRFCVGVQWHCEHRFEEHTLARALLRAFGDAARAVRDRRAGLVRRRVA
jgi:putative glutamine amidotransferase